MKPIWVVYGGLAALAWYIFAPKGSAPSVLTGEGANLAALAKSQDAAGREGISFALDSLGAQANLLASKLKDTPALGSLLGLSPTQVDYLVLPPEQFRTTYGFTADAGPLTP